MKIKELEKLIEAKLLEFKKIHDDWELSRGQTKCICNPLFTTQ